MISATNKMQQNLFYLFFYACFTCFWWQFRPSSGVLWLYMQLSGKMYRLWGLMPTGDTDWIELHPIYVTGRQQTAESVHCFKKLYIQSKFSWRWTKLSPETYRASLKESIKQILLNFWLLITFVIFSEHGLEICLQWLKKTKKGFGQYSLSPSQVINPPSREC